MKDNKITLKNFSATNRDRHIGNSMYRICRENDDSGQWYIHETFGDGIGFTGNNAYYSNSLQIVIDKLNSFTKEREIVSLACANVQPNLRDTTKIGNQFVNTKDITDALAKPFKIPFQDEKRENYLD